MADSLAPEKYQRLLGRFMGLLYKRLCVQRIPDKKNRDGQHERNALTSLYCIALSMPLVLRKYICWNTLSTRSICSFTWRLVINLVRHAMWLFAVLTYLSMPLIHGRLERQRTGPVRYSPKKEPLGYQMPGPRLMHWLIAFLLLAGTSCFLAGIVVDRCVVELWTCGCIYTPIFFAGA